MGRSNCAAVNLSVCLSAPLSICFFSMIVLSTVVSCIGGQLMGLPFWQPADC